MDEKRPTRILRRPAVKERVGLHATQIDTLERAGRFPKRIQISDRAVGWIEAEIDAWLAERIAASRASSAGGSIARPAGMAPVIFKNVETRDHAMRMPEKGEREGN